MYGNCTETQLQVESYQGASLPVAEGTFAACGCLAPAWQYLEVPLLSGRRSIGSGFLCVRAVTSYVDSVVIFVLASGSSV